MASERLQRALSLFSTAFFSGLVVNITLHLRNAIMFRFISLLHAGGRSRFDLVKLLSIYLFEAKTSLGPLGISAVVNSIEIVIDTSVGDGKIIELRTPLP